MYTEVHVYKYIYIYINIYLCQISSGSVCRFLDRYSAQPWVEAALDDNDASTWKCAKGSCTHAAGEFDSNYRQVNLVAHIRHKLKMTSQKILNFSSPTEIHSVEVETKCA